MGTLHFDGTDFNYNWWSGEQLKGTAECPLAYDSETEKIPPYRQPLEGEAPAELPPCPLTVPEVAVGMAYDGNQLVLIHPTQLKAFLNKHRSQWWVGQNFSFDFHVLLKHFRSQKDAISEEYLWRLGDDNKLCDTGILDLLLQLGTGKYRMGKGKGKGSGGDDKKLLMTNLAVLSEEWGCGELDKTDPYRLRFGEWVGLSEQEIEQHPEFANFASYALKDVIATWRVYPKQRKAGIEIMRKAGWSPNPKQKTYEIRPDALQRFGVLSEYIQVKGSIVLDQLSRTPLHIDTAKREEMEAATRRRYQLHMNSLLELEPDLFRRYSEKSPKKHLRGQIQVNKKTGLPKMNNSVLKQRLEQEADKLFIEAPISKGKNKAISLSAKDWDHLREESAFLDSWCGLGSEVKLLSFFLSMQSPDGVCYSKYNLLMRTGRTSAQQHKSGGTVLVPSFNIQQMPREDEKHPERSVRGLFRPPEGCLWGSVDYSYLELRSLAAVCKARFGFSVLADTIYKHTKQGGLDPHQRMAASILGVTEENFLQLPKQQQKDARQKGKACFHPDVELLTTQGWKRVADVGYGDYIAQYDQEQGLSWTYPTDLIRQENKSLVNLHTRHYKLRVTPDHRMYCLNWDEKPLICSPEEMPRKARKVVHGKATTGGEGGFGRLLQQVVAVQADGSLYGNRVVFGFKKQRKIDRLRMLFGDAVVGDKHAPNGVQRLTVMWNPEWDAFLYKNKRYRLDSILSCCLEDRKAFVEELQHWDGTHRTDRAFSVSSMREDVIGAIQAVAAWSGYRTVVTSWVPTNTTKTAYSVAITRTEETRSNLQIEKLDGLHTVYCVSVPTGLLLTRDQGRVQVCGNCSFGYPGGLGIDKFVAYAALQYKAQFSKAEAKEVKKKWFDLYSEMRRYLEDQTELAMKWQSDSVLAPKLSYFRRRRLSEYLKVSDKERAEKFTKEEEIDAFWHILNRIAECKEDPQLKEDVKARKVTAAVRNLVTYRACTLTGRVRNNVSYTAGANSPFQGTAADGAKEALWRLVRKGVRLMGFVHDSVEVAIPKGKEKSVEPLVNRVLIESMEYVLGQGVPVAVEGTVSDGWTKP